MKNIYICSPLKGINEELTLGKNIEIAKSIAVMFATSEEMPIVPHIFFTSFLDDTNPAHRQLGIAYGLELLKVCDILHVFRYRLADGSLYTSSGMQGEIDWWLKHKKEIHNYEVDVSNPENLKIHKV